MLQDALEEQRQRLTSQILRNSAAWKEERERLLERVRRAEERAETAENEAEDLALKQKISASKCNYYADLIRGYKKSEVQ